jgi:hypothetical protein
MMKDLAAQLAILAEHAPRLRAAGIQHLKVADLELVLAPPDPSPVIELGAADAEEPRGVLDDASTYGLPEDADVPGFKRPDDLPR